MLLVANHVSVLDPLACARLVYDNGRMPHFLAKDSVFRGPAGPILRAAGQIPVQRGTAAAQSSLGAARQALAEGELVVIYPEGSVTRDPDWWPMQPRTGVARLALTTDAVVVPVAQWGPQRVHDYQAKKLHLRLRTPAEYLVGEPIDLTDLRAQVRAGRAPDRGPVARGDRPADEPRPRPAGRGAGPAAPGRRPPAAGRPRPGRLARCAPRRGVTRAAVLSAGSWGTTFAKVLADAGCDVTL